MILVLVETTDAVTEFFKDAFIRFVTPVADVAAVELEAFIFLFENACKALEFTDGDVNSALNGRVDGDVVDLSVVYNSSSVSEDKSTSLIHITQEFFDPVCKCDFQ
jgi:hypothetical protein